MEVSTDIDWLSSEFHDLLATKTTGVALAAVRWLEDTEINGIVGWQLLEGLSARPPAAEASVLAEWVTHPARVSKITELRQPFHRGKATRRSSNEAERRSLTMTSRRSNARMHAPAATNTTGPIPMDLSFLVAKLASGATRTINVELQPSKMQIWTGSYTSPVPPAFLSKAKRTLKCFGSPSPHGR